MYIHYWYKHFQEENDDFLSNLQSAKDQIWKQQVDNFALRKQQMVVSNNTTILDKIDDILEIFSKTGTAERQAIFDANLPLNNSTVMAGDMTAGQIGAVKKIGDGEYAFVNVEKLMNNLADNVEEFINKLHQLVQTIYEQLATGQTWEQYKNAVIAEYAQTKRTVPGSKSTQLSILTDFLSQNGLKKLTTTTGGAYADQAPLQTALRNLTLLAEALPEGSTSLPRTRVSYSSQSGNVKGKTKNQAELLAVIGMKVNGMFSNVIGTGGEIAWSIAEETGNKKVNQALKKMLGEKFAIKANTSGTDRFNGQVSKGDVTVRANSENVSIQYGVSVKTYTFNTKAKYQNVSLVDNTPFLTALEKSSNIISKEQYLNLFCSLSGAPANEDGGISESNIVEQWSQANENIIINNFLDILAGNAAGAGANVLYLVFNGQIITVDQILKNFSEKEENFDFSFSLKGLKNRSAGVTLNIEGYKEKREDKQLRSDEVENKALEILRQAKIHVSLQILTTLLTK